MPRTQTKAFLRTRLQQLCDIENDTHILSFELNQILTCAMAETWDLLCDCGLAEKYVKSVTINTVANQMEYDLTSAGVISAQDFYRIHHVYVVEPGGHLRPIQKLNPSEIHAYTAPKTVCQVKLYYIPQAPVWQDGSADDNTALFDGVNGWEEHLLMTACCAVKLKREEEYSQYFRRKKELEERIRRQGNVDFGDGMSVSRKRRQRVKEWYPYTDTVSAYGIRGDKLELYYNSGARWL